MAIENKQITNQIPSTFCQKSMVFRVSGSVDLPESWVSGKSTEPETLNTIDFWQKVEGIWLVVANRVFSGKEVISIIAL